MKHWCFALAAVTLLAGPALAADKPVKVVVDGQAVTINPPALQRDGKTFIPLRSGTEAMGARVTWNPNTQTATVVMCGQIARIKASEGAMINNSLYLPLRLMSTKLGCTVKWSAPRNTVFIEKPTAGG